MTEVSKQSSIKRFLIERTVDISGTSGTGIVAEGCQLSNGRVVLTWFSNLGSVAVYDNIVVCERLHGHGGASKIVWID